MTMIRTGESVMALSLMVIMTTMTEMGMGEGGGVRNFIVTI